MQSPKNYSSIEETCNIKIVPNIQTLNYYQLVASAEKPMITNSPPNYNLSQKSISINKTQAPLEYNSIYRNDTGRKAYQNEQYVNIYDSNFGGRLGTTMGLF
tara:strand:+ start:37 stop:342 length:306 start_codon:yes stop_codon:yes gene_type:complete